MKIQKLALVLITTAFCAKPGCAADLVVVIDKSVILPLDEAIRRIAVSNGDIVEAAAVSPNELLLNGKKQGETTLMVWDSKGVRSEYNVHVQASSSDIDAVRGELEREVGSGVSMTLEGKNVFLRGMVPDEIAADRASAIAGTLGKVINLLRVAVPPQEPQILLKVRFASLSRAATQQLGFNLLSLNQKGLGATSTNQFGAPPSLNNDSSNGTVSFTDLLNIFYYRPDLDLGAAIRALEVKSLLEILAEPNLLTVSGKQASFLAGGEFPFPTIQGGAAGVGQITVQFKEFGIRLSFLPTITPRGTIRMMVAPEVSSLDYTNSLTVNGTSVPGLATRKVQTEIELERGQSFVIAGLLNNQTQEQLNKIPGLGDIPVLGKLFQSRQITKNNSELLVMVTPELVGPVPAGAPLPDIKMPKPYLKESSPTAPQQPGEKITGPIQPLLKLDSLPIELLKGGEGSNLPAAPPPPAAPAAIPMLQPPPSASANSSAPSGARP